MKLLIINGNNNKKIKIDINERSLVQDIKCKLDEILNGNGDFKLYYFKLIYKNIILSDHNSVKYYKICENYEIWFGKLENYLKQDDVMVYVFVAGIIRGSEYLIVKVNDTISKIKSIIERIHPKIINIWNADGIQMNNSQIVTEINAFEDYKLFITINDTKGNSKISYSFMDCCYFHNKRWVDRYLCLDRIRNDNKNESNRLQMINIIDKIREIISSNDTIDVRLNHNLTDLSSSYLNSGYYFCNNESVEIYCIYRDGYAFLIHYCQCRDDIMKIFSTYALFAIRAALVDFINSRRDNRNEIKKSVNSNSIQIIKNKSIKCILIDALDYFMKYLNESNNDWQYWMKTWTNQYILGSFSDYDVNMSIDESNLQKFRIRLRTSGNYSEKFTSINPKTIIAAKKTISDLLSVDIQHLYCFKPGGNHKPNDDDKFDDEFIIEIVMR